MTEEDKIVLFDTLKSIQKGIDILTEDRATDNELARQTLTAVGNLSTKIDLLESDLKNTNKTVKREMANAKETFTEVGEKIEENLEGKTKIKEKVLITFSVREFFKHLFRR